MFAICNFIINNIIDFTNKNNIKFVDCVID